MNATRRTRVALALAACALVTAPAAQASLQRDEHNYSQPVGDDHARTDAATTTPVFVPGGHGGSGEGVPASPFTTPPPQNVIAASNGFDWDDAGVGFGTAAGIALLAAGTVFSTRKLREPRVSI
jgi:hypothetical protein